MADHPVPRRAGRGPPVAGVDRAPGRRGARGAAPRFVLAASVWLSYAGDRWIEGWRLPPDRILTLRHSFYQRHRRFISGAGIIVLAADVAVAERYLLPAQMMAGIALLGAVLAYLLSHQLVHRRIRWRLPKEACVALLLTSGVALFVLAGRPALVGDGGGPPGALCRALPGQLRAHFRLGTRSGPQSRADLLARQFRQAAAFSRRCPGRWPPSPPSAAPPAPRPRGRQRPAPA